MIIIAESFVSVSSDLYCWEMENFNILLIMIGAGELYVPPEWWGPLGTWREEIGDYHQVVIWTT